MLGKFEMFNELFGLFSLSMFSGQQTSTTKSPLAVYSELPVVDWPPVQGVFLPLTW